MIRALIFDFDGVILDTETPLFQSWQEVYREYGRDLDLFTWAAGLGRSTDPFDPLDRLEAEIGRRLDREGIRAARAQRGSQLIAAQPLLPGVKGYLRQAERRGLKLGLASSSSSGWVLGHLSRLGLLGHFECIRCADDVARAKPDPELYRSVLKGLKLQASQAIAIEDSQHGITAAKQAGLFCVAVPNPSTRQLPLDGADLRLASLAELSLTELLSLAGRSTGESRHGHG